MDLRRFAFRSLVLITAPLVGCAGDQTGAGGAAFGSTDGNVHQELQIVDPASIGSSQASGMVSAQTIVNVGSVYLETQIPPVTVAGTQLQATDVATNGTDSYVTYSSVDTGGVVIKKGAVEHVTSASCDNPFTPRIEYCMSAGATYPFPDTDVFAAFADATGLWVAGSTISEDQAPMYARLYKMTLDANKNPSAIAVTQALQSYAGTGITRVGANLLVTTGTSVDPTMMGGLYSLNATTLAPINLQPLYDARAVAADPVTTSQAYVVRGAIDGTHPGAVENYPSDASTAPTREIATGGNTIAQSKSSVLVGKTLLLTSMGDQGFRVSCKATGASLATVGAPAVSGIPTALTVTNSVAALPGYILAANGEAGVYIYTFQKSSALNSSYCQGVTLTLLGRLSLSTNTGYVNGELSANSVKYVPIYDILNANLLAAKLVIIASGNKGISLVNMSQLNVSTLDVNDF